MTKKAILLMLLALALALPAQGGTAGEHTTHQWGSAVVTKNRTCTEDGVITRTCVVCGAVDQQVYPAEGHVFTDWYIDPSDRPGMCEKKCKKCYYIVYRYCDPLNVDDFPIAEVMAQDMRALGDDETIAIVHEEELLTADELEKADALSTHDKVLVVLSAAGFEEQVRQLMLGGDSLSPEAESVLSEVLARIKGLTGEEKAAFDAAREAYFPMQVISLNPTQVDYQQAYLAVQVSGPDERLENYGFSRENNQWSYQRLY